jgi:hypothetical protein
MEVTNAVELPQKKIGKEKIYKKDMTNIFLGLISLVSGKTSLISMGRQYY